MPSLPDWPIGAIDRPRSEDELLTLGEGDLARWLLDATRSWTTARSDVERLEAFSPLVFAPTERAQDQLWNRYARAAPEFLQRLRGAISEDLDLVDPTLEPGVAILLLSMAARLGCERPMASLTTLLGRRLGGPLEARAELADAVAYFAVGTLRPRDARTVAYMLREARILTGKTAVELLVTAALDYESSIVEDIQILAPALINDAAMTGGPEEEARLRRYWANELVNRLRAAQAYRLVLRAHERGIPELREAVECHRLQLTQNRSTDPSRRIVVDQLTGDMTAVDLADFDPALVARNASEDVLERRFSTDPMAEALGLERFEEPGA